MESDAGSHAPFPPRTLWSTIVERERRARERGAVQPFVTDARVVEDDGVPFLVHAVTSLARRPRADAADRRGDALLPYEPDLFVADVSATHLCLLNKYPVLNHHLLIVTRAFEPQESALGLGDFEALSRCMAEYDALAFYNSGPVAGASQPHRHLQLVPLPLAAGDVAVPAEVWLDHAPRQDGALRVGRIPFRHAFAWLARGVAVVRFDAETAARAYATYQALLSDAGLDPASPAPYNLIVTRRYMLLVPRVRERFQSVAVNALGFAGSFFVPSREGLETIIRAGPVAVLRGVAQRP